jgi:hypothetical protein
MTLVRETRAIPASRVILVAGGRGAGPGCQDAAQGVYFATSGAEGVSGGGRGGRDAWAVAAALVGRGSIVRTWTSQQQSWSTGCPSM